MISMARIQGSSMGYQGFQKPIIQMGQDSFSSGPVGAGVTPPAAPMADLNFLNPNYAYPNYAFPVQEVPVPAPTPAVTALPTWGIIGIAAIGGAIVASLLLK